MKPVVEKVIKLLKYEFTQDELLEIGRVQARELSAARAAERRASEVKKQLTADIDAHANAAAAQSEKINNGYEYRDIECEQTRDYENARIVTVRLDTKETVEDRKMRAAELQLGIDDPVAEEEEEVPEEGDGEGEES